MSWSRCALYAASCVLAVLLGLLGGLEVGHSSRSSVMTRTRTRTITLPTKTIREKVRLPARVVTIAHTDTIYQNEVRTVTTPAPAPAVAAPVKQKAKAVQPKKPEKKHHHHHHKKKHGD